MNQTTLNFNITKNNEFFHAELAADDGKIFAKNSFAYKLDNITILTEIDDFDLSKKSPAERNKRMRGFGENLYKKVFSKKMTKSLKEALKNTDWLRFVIRIDEKAKELSQIPWEFLHDSSDFIACNEKISLYRCPQGIKYSPLPSIDNKIKILCLISNPLDLEDKHRLNAEIEQERMLQALNSALATQNIEIEFEDEANLENLEAAFDEGKYHILHYSGHGSFSKEKGGELLLEDESGKAHPVGLQKLESIFKKGMAKGLRLIFLSGCQTAKTRGRDAFKDLARPLLKIGMPAIIAMQYSMYDESGILLAEIFYKGVARGDSIDVALNNARRRLRLNEKPWIEGDFATPVLFTNNPDCLESKKQDKLEDVISFDIKADSWAQVPLQQLGTGFIGRRKELREIKNLFLRQNIRAIILHGIGGIGKTVTATQAARRMRKFFHGVIAFDCGQGAVSSDRIVTDIHQFLSLNGYTGLQDIVHAQLTAIQKATYLAQIFEKMSLLLIFDNMESLLDDEQKRSIKDPDLAGFFKTLINGTTRGTKFMFTSRYTFNLLQDKRKDNEIQTIGYRLQQAFHEINLADVSRPEAHMIMNKFPSLITADYQLKNEIYEKLGGHPYALTIFAHFCRQKAPCDVLFGLKEVNTEMARFTMMDMAWDRLSGRAKNLLKRISVFEKAVYLNALEWVLGEEQELDPSLLALEKERIKENILKSDDEEAKKWLEGLKDDELEKFIIENRPKERKAELITADIEELIHWGLIVLLSDEENEGSRYIVHHLVKEFCRQKMEQEEYKSALIDAADFYLNEAKKYPNESQGQVFTKLDARNFFFRAKEFEKAANIVNEVQEFLNRWGFISLLEQLLYESVETLTGKSQAIALGSLATIYKNRGKYDKAVELYEQVYKVFEEINNQYNMAVIRHQIGMIYQDKGEYEKALNEYKTSLEIKEQINDKKGIGESCHQIGNIYYLQGEYEKALIEYRASLEIAEQIGDKSGISDTRHQIGIIYQDTGEYEKALNEYKASLEIAEELGDKNGIANTIGQLGLIDEEQENYENAFEKYIMAFSIFIELQSPNAQISVNNLKRLRSKWGAENFDEAWAAKTGGAVPEAFLSEL
jgi:CHAT domain-containing protein/lipopolysaccharide biosynthesis regulator YciM